jgi:hypothetical protein
MTYSMPEIADLARQHAADFIPGAQTLTQKELTTQVTELARRSPDTARQMLDDTCVDVNQATNGRYSGEMDNLRNLVIEALGLAPGII